MPVGSKTKSQEMAVKAITNAYIAVHQDITQGLAMRSQILLENSGESCAECRAAWQIWRAGGESPKAGVCTGLCRQTVEMVHTDASLKFTAKGQQAEDVQQKLSRQIQNAIALQASEQGDFLEEDGFSKTNETIKTVSKSLVESDAGLEISQRLQQVLDGRQYVAVSGPGELRNVNLEATADFVSRVLQQDTAVAEQTTVLAEDILQMTKTVVNASANSIIVWIIRIAVLLLWVVVLLFSVQVVFDIYILIVT